MPRYSLANDKGVQTYCANDACWARKSAPSFGLYRPSAQNARPAAGSATSCPAPRWLGRRIRGITDTRSIHQTLHLATAVHSGAIDATLAGTRRLFRRRAGKSAGLVLLLHRNAPTQCAAELVICGRRARLLEGFRRTVAGQTQAALGLRNTANVSPSRRHCQHLRTTIPHRAARAPPRAGRSDAPRAAPRS